MKMQKNVILIRKDIETLMNKLTEKFPDLKNNNTYDNKEIKELNFNDGVYSGQVENGKPEGKGIFRFKNEDKYEGEFINGKKDGRGIYYFNIGDRYDGY